jgi:hypothetical protein
MTEGYDDLAHPGASGAGGSGGGRDPSESSAPSGWLRGVGVVAVAVVIGVLLMPSATRAPLLLKTVATSTPTTTPPRSASTTTTVTLPSVVPGASAIHVLVANGTTVINLAGGTSTYLRSRGFSTLPALDAKTKVTATQVYPVSGSQSAAETVVEVLGLSSSAVQPTSAAPPVASAAGATVVVIAGTDLARLAPSG